jgi:hypothetical protein
MSPCAHCVLSLCCRAASPSLLSCLWICREHRVIYTFRGAATIIVAQLPEACPRYFSWIWMCTGSNQERSLVSRQNECQRCSITIAREEGKR